MTIRVRQLPTLKYGSDLALAGFVGFLWQLSRAMTVKAPHADRQIDATAALLDAQPFASFKNLGGLLDFGEPVLPPSRFAMLE